MKTLIALLLGCLLFLAACGGQGDTNNPPTNPPTTPPEEPGGITTNFSQYSGTLTFQNTDETSLNDRQYYAYDLNLKTNTYTPLYQVHPNYGTVFKAKNGEVVYENDVPDLIVRKPGFADSLFVEGGYVNLPFQGVLSDDGKLLAFTRQIYNSFGSDTYQVEVMDRNKNLLATFENLYTPAWTPEGRLVMVGERGLYITDTSFNNLQRLGPNISNPQTPSVSPDGNKVAFAIDGQLFTMNLNGSNLKQITASGNELYWPAWSPDGKFIVANLKAGLYENRIVILPADPAEPTYVDNSFVLTVKNGRKTFYLEANTRITWR